MVPSAYYEHTLCDGDAKWVLLELDTTDVGVNGSSAELKKEGIAFIEKHKAIVSNGLFNIQRKGRPEAVPWNGGVGRVQMAWLKSRLEAARNHGARAIIVGHHPLLTAASKPNGAARAFNHEELVETIGSYADVVAACLCGHYHWGGYTCHNNIHHITIKGAVETGAHAVLSIHDDGHLEYTPLAVDEGLRPDGGRSPNYTPLPPGVLDFPPHQKVESRM